MKILAINTSSVICSVALLEDDKLIMEKHIIDEKTHSQKLMPLIDSLLKENRLTLEKIDLFACSVGPGSFTGVRIGVSTVKAFADVTQKPVTSISSLEALAYNAFDSYFKEEVDIICPLIDAKNNNVYFGLFKKTKENTLTRIEDLQFNKIDTIISFLDEKYDTSRIIFIGDGATSYKYKILETLRKAKFAVEALNRESSINIGKCGYLHYLNGNYGDSNFVTPLYLRKSQAERALEGED